MSIRPSVSESRPAKAGVRATGMSDDDRTSRPRFHQWQLWHAMFRFQHRLFIIATAHRVSEGTMPSGVSQHSGQICTRTRRAGCSQVHCSDRSWLERLFTCSRLSFLGLLHSLSDQFCGKLGQIGWSFQTASLSSHLAFQNLLSNKNGLCFNQLVLVGG